MKYGLLVILIIFVIIITGCSSKFSKEDYQVKIDWKSYNPDLFMIDDKLPAFEVEVISDKKLYYNIYEKTSTGRTSLTNNSLQNGIKNEINLQFSSRLLLTKSRNIEICIRKTKEIKDFSICEDYELSPYLNLKIEPKTIKYTFKIDTNSNVVNYNHYEEKIANLSVTNNGFSKIKVCIYIKENNRTKQKYIINTKNIINPNCLSLDKKENKMINIQNQIIPSYFDDGYSINFLDIATIGIVIGSDIQPSIDSMLTSDTIQLITQINNTNPNTRPKDYWDYTASEEELRIFYESMANS